MDSWSGVSPVGSVSGVDGGNGVHSVDSGGSVRGVDGRGGVHSVDSGAGVSGVDGGGSVHSVDSGGGVSGVDSGGGVHSVDGGGDDGRSLDDWGADLNFAHDGSVYWHVNGHPVDVQLGLNLGDLKQNIHFIDHGPTCI